ncbi:MAG: phospholipase D/Transphosphatidylase [Chthoniobacteraceae bacterium]|nr:phospholipase D/Transphosphatidylase [Chthoniobacteraceae bacterium]
MRPIPKTLALTTLTFILGVIFSDKVPLVRDVPAIRKIASTRSVAKSVEAHFSPKGGCTEKIVEELGRAKKTILVQAYSFTSAPIAEALVAAYRRGVSVQVLLDKSQRSEKYSSADFVAHARIPTYIDAKHAIAHNKIMIIDNEVIITGSFNFTKAAEASNAENLLVIHDTALAACYTDNWKLHKEHSEAYAGR